MRTERENYVIPEMEVVEFEVEDVITSSDNTTPSDPINPETGFIDDGI